jgi:hypothetical protein
MTSHVPGTARARARLKLASISLGLIAITACAPQNGTPGIARPQDGIPGPPEATPGKMDDYVQQIDFGAGADPSGIFEGPMKCGMPAKCGGQTDVHIRIVPSNYATTADWKKALGNGNGYVVAKVSNMDAVPFDRLNLAPYDVAYVWVGANQGQARTAVLYTVRSGIVHRVFTFKALSFCQDSTPQKPAVHIYTPAKCSGNLTSRSTGPAVRQASIEPFSAIASYLVNALTRAFAPPPGLDGLWISCSYGCCEAQFD